MSRRQLILAGVGAAALGNGGMLAASAHWSAAMAKSRITVLGSGSEPSLLITAGAARVVIAGGDSAADFSDALANSRYQTTRRVDLLLLLPSGIKGGVAAKAVEVARGRYTWRIGSLPLTGETAHLGAYAELPSPRRIRLADGISVHVESLLPATTLGSSTEPACQITVRRGRTTVVVLSGPGAVTAFPRSGPVSAMICPETVADVAEQRFKPKTVIVSAGKKNSKRSATGRISAWRFPVPSGEALHLDYQAGGLRLSGQSWLATPEPRAESE